MHQEPSRVPLDLKVRHKAERMLAEMCGAKGGEHLLPHCLLDREIYPEQDEQTHLQSQDYQISTRLTFRPGYD
jgi:hypothetical protein